MAAEKNTPAPHESAADKALNAIDEANLSDSGYHYLAGTLAGAAPDAVHAALAQLHRHGRTEHGRRYFRTDEAARDAVDDL